MPQDSATEALLQRVGMHGVAAHPWIKKTEAFAHGGESGKSHLRRLPTTAHVHTNGSIVDIHMGLWPIRIRPMDEYNEAIPIKIAVKSIFRQTWCQVWVCHGYVCKVAETTMIDSTAKLKRRLARA